MRIARFTHAGRTGLGAVVDDAVVDLQAGTPSLAPDLLVHLERGDLGLDRLRQALADAPAAARIPLDEVRLEAPIPRPPVVYALALNYADHQAETGQDRPEFLKVFTKSPSCIVGPVDAIEVPRASSMVDYEGELGVVIGRRCRHVPADRALEVVAGYLIVDDVSVRDWQRRSPTMILGKSWDTHGPTGPWLTTADEVADPQDLAIRTTVSGEVLQDGTTADMLWSIAEQIETLSTSGGCAPSHARAGHDHLHRHPRGRRGGPHPSPVPGAGRRRGRGDRGPRPPRQPGGRRARAGAVPLT